MKIEFHCTACGAEMTSEEQLRGELLRCPACDGEVLVPLTSVGPGVVVNGFKILRRIGSGGMGAVYLAEQKSMGRLVALKVLPAAFTRDPLFFDRFMKEVHLQGSLSHPNLATAYDAGKFGDICYMAMEFVEGFDLAEMIDKKGHLEERAALRIARKIAAGLAYAWKKRHLIHRDIKPGNVMIAPNAEVKILDLGVSKSLHPSGDKNLSTEEQVIGTPHYMSPEQMRESASVDIRSDMYSLGATLYHMLAGRPPFSGDDLVEVVSRQGEGPAASPQDEHPELSAACMHLLEVMMAREPDERHDTWDHVIADINRVLLGGYPSQLLPVRGGSMVARPRVPSRPAGFSRGRAVRLAVQVMVGLAVAAGLIVVVMHFLPGWSSRWEAGQEPASIPARLPAGPTASADELGTRMASLDAEAGRDPEGTEAVSARYLRLGADAEIAGMPELAEEAGARARELRDERGIRAHEAMRELEASARPLVDRGRYAEAAALLREYEGPYARATVRRRLRRADELDALAREQSEAAWNGFQRELADRLIEAGALTPALPLLSDAQTNAMFGPVRDELLALEDDVREALRVPDEIIASFAGDTGREVEVELVRGTRSLVIDRVDARSVIARQRLPGGSLQYTFGYRDLARGEKVERLNRLSTPAADVVLGLLALESDQADAAAGYFERAGTRLGVMLSGALRGSTEP